MYPEKASELSTRVTVRVNTSLLQLINMWKLIFQHLIIVGVQNKPLMYRMTPLVYRMTP